MKDSEQQLKEDIKELKNKLRDDGHKVEGNKRASFDIKKVLLYALPFIIIIIFVVGFLAGAQFTQEDQGPADQGAAPAAEEPESTPTTDTQEPAGLPPEDTTIEIVYDEHGCFDSDGGSIPGTRGFVLDAAGNNYTDNCTNIVQLKEYYCGPLGYYSSKTIDCPGGCEEGVCLEGGASEPSSECFDSDKGSFPDIKGYVIDKSDSRYDDECASETVLKEMRCGIADYVAVSTISCDYLCQDGKCIEGTKPPEPKCFDSDAANEFVKGYVKDINGDTHDDVCLNAFTVTEGRCNSFGYYNKIYIDCANGCLNGACLQNQ